MCSHGCILQRTFSKHPKLALLTQQALLSSSAGVCILRETRICALTCLIVALKAPRMAAAPPQSRFIPGIVVCRDIRGPEESG